LAYFRASVSRLISCIDLSSGAQPAVPTHSRHLPRRGSKACQRNCRHADRHVSGPLCLQLRTSGALGVGGIRAKTGGQCVARAQGTLEANGRNEDRTIQRDMWQLR
jgi:hypothetical protein